MKMLTLTNCINTVCPWSGKPVAESSLAHYRGHVVGFCNTGCKNKFETATKMFEELICSPPVKPLEGKADYF